MPGPRSSAFRRYGSTPTWGCQVQGAPSSCCASTDTTYREVVSWTESPRAHRVIRNFLETARNSPSLETRRERRRRPHPPRLRKRRRIESKCLSSSLQVSRRAFAVVRLHFRPVLPAALRNRSDFATPHTSECGPTRETWVEPSVGGWEMDAFDRWSERGGRCRGVPSRAGDALRPGGSPRLELGAPGTFSRFLLAAQTSLSRKDHIIMIQKRTKAQSDAASSCLKYLQEPAHDRPQK